MKDLSEFDASGIPIDLFEMANARQSETGLPVIIFVSTAESSHGPRIKVQADYATKVNHGNWFAMTIEDEPVIVANVKNANKLSQKDLAAVARFIRINRQLLLDLWDQEISHREFLNQMVPVMDR